MLLKSYISWSREQGLSTRWELLQTLPTLQRLIELGLTMLSSVASVVALSVLAGVSNALATPVARQTGTNILLSNDDGCESDCSFPCKHVLTTCAVQGLWQTFALFIKSWSMHTLM